MQYFPFLFVQLKRKGEVLFTGLLSVLIVQRGWDWAFSRQIGIITMSMRSKWSVDAPPLHTSSSVVVGSTQRSLRPVCCEYRGPDPDKVVVWLGSGRRTGFEVSTAEAWYQECESRSSVQCPAPLEVKQAFFEALYGTAYSGKSDTKFSVLHDGDGFLLVVVV